MTLDKMPDILIIGPSGSGKTTSFRNMDRQTTEYIDIEEKALPFPRNFKFHHHPLVIEGKAPDEEIDPGRVLEQDKKAMKTAIENPKSEVIIRDSFTKWDEMLLSYQRIVNRNYDIYNGHNESVKKILNRYKGCGKPIVWTGIDDVVKIETANEIDVIGRRLKVYGRELEGTLEKEFTIVLFTETVKQANGSLKYFFRTHGDGVCSAKTPMGMFKEDLIDNDLKAVMDRVWEFYEEQEEEETPKKVAVKKPAKR